MLPNRSLIFSGQKAKTIWYFSILDLVGYINEKPADHSYNYDTRHNLSSPPDKADISPNGNTLVGQISQYCFHFAILNRTCFCQDTLRPTNDPIESQVNPNASKKLDVPIEANSLHCSLTEHIAYLILLNVNVTSTIDCATMSCTIYSSISL